jgi:hypothetical protein
VRLLSWLAGEPVASTYYWGFVIGLILLLLLSYVPVIGVLAFLLLYFFGVGSLWSWLVLAYCHRTVSDAGEGRLDHETTGNRDR